MIRLIISISLTIFFFFFISSLHGFVPTATNEFNKVNRLNLVGSTYHNDFRTTTTTTTAMTTRTTRTRLSMTNETQSNTDKDTDDINDGPLKNIKQAWDTFSASSTYRTMIFTAALFSNEKTRNLVGGIPGCTVIFLITLLIYTYESKFNYLVDNITPRRQVALKKLRDAKLSQFSTSSTSTSSTTAKATTATTSKEEEYKILALEYETILREELDTRVLIPGIWNIEMDPQHEDRIAAPQLLGLTITDDYKLVPLRNEENKKGRE